MKAQCDIHRKQIRIGKASVESAPFRQRVTAHGPVYPFHSVHLLSPLSSLAMLPLLQFITLLLHFIFVSSFSAASAQNHEDPTIRTMEAFSGYPVHEPSSYVFSNPITSLSVDADTLVKQVWKSNGFQSYRVLIGCNYKSILMGSDYLLCGFGYLD